MSAGVLAVRAGLRARRLLLARRLQAELSQGAGRALGMAAIGLSIAAAVFGAGFGAGWFALAKGAPELVRTIASGALLGLSAALVLSSLGHAAQCFFSSQDLWFWDSTPAPSWARFVDRAVETAVAAAPTTLGLGLLGLTGLVTGAHLGVLAVARAAAAVVLVASIPVSLGIVLAHAGGALLPAGKLRRISIVVLGVAVCAGLVWFREARIEKALSPEGAAELLASARAVKEVGPALLPSALGAGFVVEGDALGFVGLLAWAVALAGLALASHKLLSRRARDLAVDESPVGLLRGSVRESLLRAALRPVPKELLPVVEKDLLAFFRDPAQWGQVILLLGVGALYLVNASVLRDGFAEKSGLLGNTGLVVLPAMHTGLVSFIAAGLSARFAFPQLGLEGPAVWIVDGSPLSPRALLRAKVYAAVPVVVLYPTAVAMVGGFVLHLQPLLWALTSLACASVALGVSAFGVGRGAMKPLFDATSLSELAIGPGALSTMLWSVTLAAFGSFGALVAGGGVLAGAQGFVPAPAGAAIAVAAVALPAAVALLLGRRALALGAAAFVRRREDEATRQFFADVARPIVVE